MKNEELWKKISTENADLKETVEMSQMVSDMISRIVIERNRQGLTQRDLAIRTGIKQPAIARIESLRVVPKIDTLAKIAYHLGLTLELNDVAIAKNKIQYIYYIDTDNRYNNKNQHSYANAAFAFSETECEERKLCIS